MEITTTYEIDINDEHTSGELEGKDLLVEALQVSVRFDPEGGNEYGGPDGRLISVKTASGQNIFDKEEIAAYVESITETWSGDELRAWISDWAKFGVHHYFHG